MFETHDSLMTFSMIEEVVHFKYDLNINQNITYNSDLYFHETVTLCNELPSFYKQYTNISFTEINNLILDCYIVCGGIT